MGCFWFGFGFLFFFPSLTSLVNCGEFFFLTSSHCGKRKTKMRKEAGMIALKNISNSMFEFEFGIWLIEL